MLQSFISFQENSSGYDKVSPEEIVKWENFAVSLCMITESRIHSFTADV